MTQGCEVGVEEELTTVLFVSFVTLKRVLRMLVIYTVHLYSP